MIQNQSNKIGESFPLQVPNWSVKQAERGIYSEGGRSGGNGKDPRSSENEVVRCAEAS